MKSKLYILLLSLFVLQACVKDEEKAFDASPAERINTAIRACKATLCAAPNGWIMEYYPETDRSLGGCNLICKFNAGGTVAIAGETTQKNPAGATATSTYELLLEEAVTLTFNTYNEVLHYFTEPTDTDVDGLAGDYEFIIREVTPGQIVMTGKKYGNRVVMTPYTSPATWQEYLAQFDDRADDMLAFVYTLSVDGHPVPVKRITRQYRTFYFAYEDDGHNKALPYILTPDGIKLYEPLTVAGKTVQHFTISADKKTLTGVENNVEIKCGKMAPNRILAEADAYWSLNFTQFTGENKNLVSKIIDKCSQNLTSGFGEVLANIYMGDSPIAPYPGRGLLFGTFGADGTWYSQFFYDFTPVGDNLKIEYKGGGLNKEYYYKYFNPFINALAQKSPYSVTIDDPIMPTRMTLKSLAEPGFYFDLSDPVY